MGYDPNADYEVESAPKSAQPDIRAGMTTDVAQDPPGQAEKIAALREKMKGANITHFDPPSDTKGKIAEWLTALGGTGPGSANFPGLAGVVGGVAGKLAGQPFRTGYDAGTTMQNDINARNPSAAVPGTIASMIMGPVGKAVGSAMQGAPFLAKAITAAGQGGLQGLFTTRTDDKPQQTMDNIKTGMEWGLGGQALGSAIGGGLNAASKMKMLDPIINRLKFLKPTPQEAQPLSEEGTKIREALADTKDSPVWNGVPSRETVLERLQKTQAPQGKRISDILSQADRENANQPNIPSNQEVGDVTQAAKVGARDQQFYSPIDPAVGEHSPMGLDLNPNSPFSNSDLKLKDMMRNSATSGASPERLRAISQEQKQNFLGASPSFSDLNGVKQNIYNQTYTPNTPEMGENFLPNRDQLLRSMGRDVKHSIQDGIQKLSDRPGSELDPKNLLDANKQYGTAQTLIDPLNRAVGSDIGDAGHGARLHMSPGSAGASVFGDMLNVGGRRYLGQAKLGEMLGKGGDALSKYTNPQAVIQGFLTQGLPKSPDDEDPNTQ